MAKIKFGMMMTDARGKLGGQVFSKNRSGAYVRTKVTPVNPRTSFQQLNRSALASVSSAWAGLTESQRKAWNSVVSEWQKTNVFGDLQKPSGKNLFTGLNKNRSVLFPALPMLLNPPAKAEFQSFLLKTATVSVSSGISLIVAGAGSSAKTFSIRATPSLSPTISFVDNALRGLGGAITSGEAGLVELNVPYLARFGGYVIGNAITFEFRQADANGQLGAPQLIKAIVVA